jgi:hypothetical protein
VKARDALCAMGIAHVHFSLTHFRAGALSRWRTLHWRALHHLPA